MSYGRVVLGGVYRVLLTIVTLAVSEEPLLPDSVKVVPKRVAVFVVGTAENGVKAKSLHVLRDSPFVPHDVVMVGFPVDKEGVRTSMDEVGIG